MSNKFSTRNFNMSEFTCRCGCGMNVDPKLIMVMQAVRAYWKQPITITSGARCPKHNAVVSKATKSRHMAGDACDFIVKGISPQLVAGHLRSIFPNSCGVAYSNKAGFTHLDLREERADWTY